MKLRKITSSVENTYSMNRHLNTQSLLTQLFGIIRSKGKTIKGVCSKYNIPTTNIFEWKQGKRLPSLDSFIRVLYKLGYELVIMERDELKDKYGTLPTRIFRTRGLDDPEPTSVKVIRLSQHCNHSFVYSKQDDTAIRTCRYCDRKQSAFELGRGKIQWVNYNG